MDRCLAPTHPCAVSRELVVERTLDVADRLVRVRVNERPGRVRADAARRRHAGCVLWAALAWLAVVVVARAATLSVVGDRI